MTNSQEHTKVVQINTSTIIKALLVFFVAYLIYKLSDVFLALLVSIVIASAIEPFTKWFVSRRIPRVLAVVVIYFSIATIMAGIVYLFVPQMISDTRELANKLPEYIDTLSDKASTVGGIQAPQNFLDNLNKTIDEKLYLQNQGNEISNTTFGFISIATAVFGGLISFIMIFVLSFYFSVQEDGVKNFLKIITPIQHEKYVLDLWERSKRKIGLWMQGQILLAVLVGILTFLGLTILGVENALFLAIIAGILEIIPVFGPIIAAIPAVAIAIPQGGITLALLVAGLYLIIQQFENHLFHPLVVKKIVGIPALIAIISLIVGAKLAGFIGIILAVPLAAAIMEYLNDVEKKKAEELKKISN